MKINSKTVLSILAFALPLINGIIKEQDNQKRMEKLIDEKVNDKLSEREKEAQ